MTHIWRFLAYLLSFLLGAALLIGGLRKAWAKDALMALWDYIEAHNVFYSLGITGMALMMIPLLAVARWYAAKRYGREIRYTNDLGTVSVSLIAVEEALTRAVEAQESVRKVTLRVFEDRAKRLLVVEAALTLWDDGNVTGINRICQSLLRRRLAELMPEVTAVQVDLTVHRINHRRPGESRDAAADAEPARSTTVAAEPTDPRSEAPATRRRTQVGPEVAVRSESRRITDEFTSQSDSPEPQPAAAAGDSDDSEDVYANLYHGPTYPVAKDDEDDEVPSRTS